MKKIIAAVAVLLVSAATLLAQNPKSLYRKYSDMKDVTAVYISPAMFRLIGHLPEVKAAGDDVDLSPVIRSLSGMYIINCEKPSVANQLIDEVEGYLDSGAYELLMEAKEDGDLTRMYTVGDEETVRSFVLLNIEPDEATFISIEGNIPRGALEQMIVKSAE